MKHTTIQEMFEDTKGVIRMGNRIGQTIQWPKEKKRKENNKHNLSSVDNVVLFILHITISCLIIFHAISYICEIFYAISYICEMLLNMELTTYDS
jgi:hypothetical protein